MEDAHAVDLSLDEGAENANAFFAVHGGTFETFFNPSSHFLILLCKWRSGQIFQDQRSHEACNWNIISRETVRLSYEEAPKTAFWGTDEDFLAG